MSKHPRWFGIFLAKFVLVCGCAPHALYGQSYPTATWTGGGNDGSWSNGKNWQWDNSQCNDPNSGIAVPPATFSISTSPCYIANVMIGSGVTVNENDDAFSPIYNFSLGANSTLNGAAGATGNVTIGSGAILNGNASAAGNVTIGSGAIVNGNAAAGVPSSTSGVVTNQGTIYGSVSGATVINQKGAIIQPIVAAAVVLATMQGTNQGLIEALNAGGGPHLNATGALSLTGPWNNAGGTIQIDNGAVLTCDATITNGDLIDNGSGVVAGAGDGLTIAGTVNSTSLTIDGPGGPTTVTVTGTLNNTGTLTVGQTSSVSTINVNSGGALNVTGLTILGAQAGATGQMIIAGTSSPITTQGLTIGLAGSGYVQVSGATLNARGVIIGSQPPGNGILNVGVKGIVNYTGLIAISGSTIYGAAISISSSGNLVGLSSQQSVGSQAAPTERGMLRKEGIVSSSDSRLSAVAQVSGIWKVQSGLTVSAGGSLTVSAGGGVSTSCTGCISGSTSLDVIGNSTINVIGSMSTLAVAGDSSIEAGSTLTVHVGAQATLGSLQNAGTVTLDGNGSLMTLNVYTSMGGVLGVQNEAKLSADQISLYTFNTNKFTIQSGAAVSAQVVRVFAGAALIETGGALNISQESNPDSRALHPAGMFAGDGYEISLGAGAVAATLTLSDTGKLSTQSIAVYPGGVLQITNKDSVTVSDVVSLDELVLGSSRQAGGAINVLQGALNIGTVSGSGRQGWVTVGPSGALKGGVICPVTPSPENPCIPNMLVGPGTVDGSVANVGGTVSLDPTTLSVTQNFQQTSGTLDLEIQGTQAGQYDQITAGGSIQITGGTVEFDFGSGFAPSSGDKFNLLSAPGGVSISGASLTTTGLASGFNYTTSTSSGQFDLAASNDGTATTSAPAPPPTPTLASSDSASGAAELAPGSLASGYGTGLATGQPASATYIWPTTIGGTSISIVDVTGVATQAPLLYVSPTEVDYQIPDTVAPGPATVTVTASDGTMKSGPINVVSYAPGLFEVNSAGLSASFADCVAASGAQTTILTSQVVNGALVAVPLDLKACQETILELWSTGLDQAEADASTLQVTIGGQDATVLYAGPEGVYPGVDQVNVVIPPSLAGAGNVPVVLSIGGVTSNTVNVTIQ